MEPFFHRLGGEATPACARRHIAMNYGKARKLGPFPYRDVIVHSGTGAQHDEILKRDTAGYAALGNDDAMSADHHVMGNLNEIIDFSALADHRVADATAIDRGAGAYFHVVLNNDSAELRNFRVSADAHDVTDPPWPMLQPAWIVTPSPIMA